MARINTNVPSLVARNNLLRSGEELLARRGSGEKESQPTGDFVARQLKPALVTAICLPDLDLVQEVR